MVRTLIQRRLRRTIRLCLALSCMGVSGANADWQVEFPAVKDGRPCHSIAFPSEDGLMLVAVVLSGADATRPEVKSDGVVIPVKMLGHDPVSRLCFFRPDPAVGLGRIVWEAKAPMASGFEMMSGSQRAPTSGWVKQVGTKVLPLALLRVNFDGSVPP